MTSSKDIFNQAPPHAKVFISFDLLHSYFQVRVAEEDWELLAFVIPGGKFCFTRLIQGHLNLGDHLNINSQCILVGLHDALQIMDDFMSACMSLKDAYLRGSTLLTNAVKRNWKFSRRKAQVSTKITFCGLTIEATPKGKVLVTPSAQRLEELKALEVPRSIPEVRRVVGVFQTFNVHVASLSTKIPNLQKLAHKSDFQWNSDLQSEFEKAKEAINKHLILSPFDPQLPLQMFVDASAKGFGLVLVHPDVGESKKFLFAASAVAKDVHTRYTSYELELCGLVWALRKISYYRLGNKHVEILTDHWALESAMSRDPTPDLSNRVFQLLEEALSCNISIR